MADSADDSLERLLAAFPSQPAQRQTWREASRRVDEMLRAEGHLGLPALIPGLVHARLATALLAAGYRNTSALGSRSFLCLGCHAGLEVRILKDLGASSVFGLEVRSDVVQAGYRASLIGPEDVGIGDFWDGLPTNSQEGWDEVLSLAPQHLPVTTLWNRVEPFLKSGGHFIIVAQPTDVSEIPEVALTGTAMEGTMRWYLLSNE